jgi:hypothetical protein
LLRRFGVMELHLSPRVNESLKWIADRQMVAYALLLVVLMLVKHGDFSGLNPSRFRRPRIAANPAV